MDCRCGCPMEIHRNNAGQCFGVIGGQPCMCIRYRAERTETDEVAAFDVLCWDTCCLHYWPEGLMSSNNNIPEIVDWMIPTPSKRVQ